MKAQLVKNLRKRYSFVGITGYPEKALLVRNGNASKGEPNKVAVQFPLTLAIKYFV